MNDFKSVIYSEVEILVSVLPIYWEGITNFLKVY